MTDKKINFQRTYLPIIPLFSNPPFINELSQSALLVHPVCERLESDKTGWDQFSSLGTGFGTGKQKSLDLLFDSLVKFAEKYVCQKEKIN